MKEEQDYTKDIAEIRSMMERSTKFLSLSGMAGVMAGIYALVGSFVAFRLLEFQPDTIGYRTIENGGLTSSLMEVIFVGTAVLILAVGTAIFLSARNAHRNGVKLWNANSRRMVINMFVPLLTGGLLIIVIISKGLTGLIAPLTLIFYGLALYNAGKFTYEEIKSLGLIEVGLGLLGSFFIEYGLLFWAIGFGLFHIIYGIYMHYRYER